GRKSGLPRRATVLSRRCRAGSEHNRRRHSASTRTATAIAFTRSGCASRETRTPSAAWPGSKKSAPGPGNVVGAISGAGLRPAGGTTRDARLLLVLGGGHRGKPHFPRSKAQASPARVALERELDQAVEQLRITDPGRLEELRVHARRGKAGDRVQLVDED